MRSLQQTILLVIRYVFWFTGLFLRQCYQYVKARGRALLRPTPFPASFQDFIRINSAFWNSRIASVPEGQGEYILVEGLVSHPGYLLLNAVIARYLAHETGLPMVALLPSRTDCKNRKLFESYGVRDFIFLSDRKRRMLDMLRYGLLAARLLRRCSGGDDLLAIELDGIDFGRLVYDQFVMSTGHGTIENISPLIFEMLVDALYYRRCCDQLFEQHRFPLFVLAERNYIRGGVLSQVALKHGTVIYSRGGGPTRITMRRYDDLSQILTFQLRPSEEVFECVYENHREKAIAAADAHMARRFSGRMTSVQLAFSKDQRVVSKEELCRQFGWSVNKPIVCILSHAFIDAVHSHNWWLFRDYLTWLRCTLRTIRTMDHVNWLVKPNPYEKLYKNSKHTAQGEYEALAADCEHIRLMPKDANSSSLLNIAHAILTVCGSPGIEFSCFGVPCVLAGEAPYSGFGFTIEPQSQEEYFALLQNIHTLEPLSDSQVERAKVAAYIYLELSMVKFSLIPDFSPLADYDEEALWREAANRIQDHDLSEDRLYQMFQIQIRQEYRHLLNYDWIGWS